MLRPSVETVDYFFVSVGSLTGEDIFVYRLIGDSHLIFVCLTVKQPGRGSFVYDRGRCCEPAQKLSHLGCGEVGDRVKIAGTVTPLGEVAHIYLTSVARAGDQSELALCDRVQRCHSESRSDIVDSCI